MLLIQNDLQFERIFNEYWEIMYKSAFSRIREQEVVEDLLQEVFIDIWQRRTEITIQSTLKAYLLTAVKYRVLKYMDKAREKRAREIEGADVPYLDVDVLGFEDLYHQLEVVIAKLPPRNRLVFQMSRLEGFSSDEIAEKLGISQQTVHNHLSKSLTYVRAEMKHLAPGFLLFINL
ncbi:hypothetical protein P872_13035 [Rhodonellum psychrophilum GCM71 = DSM 17998]|uniref:HTH luxR-type domain-containing protein n=2 Tax=Rhodonellum TaxID=336827 RepID=U5BRI0_9BACT|nr:MULTISPECIES: sigma-70 family RNA polymerase sigma factor [Rhodonellum]ERM80503.1 hypothetical protein P872_13035 [Rhodonellum psychrophilum GCM71 = DSM 17998]SDZ24236.1 RNA polymerase sigma-70 factor, ECF subfamily [Rhodonellum ikkaensis]